MPYKSKAQAAYFNIHRKELERQGVDVDEWNESTRGKKLPDKIKKEKTASRGDQILKLLSSAGTMQMPREMGDAMEIFIRKNMGMLHQLEPGLTPEEGQAIMAQVRSQQVPGMRNLNKLRKVRNSLNNTTNTLDSHLANLKTKQGMLHIANLVKEAMPKMPKSYYQNLARTNPELHKQMSRLGGWRTAANARKTSDAAEREARIQRAMNPPKPAQMELSLDDSIKTGSAHTQGLLTGKDFSDLKKYVLSKDELQTPRELSEEEKKRLEFRRKAGWSWGNPLDDIKKRDVFHHIQNPTYRAAADILGSNIPLALSSAYLPLALSIHKIVERNPKGNRSRIPFKLNFRNAPVGVGLAATFGALNILPPLMNIKNNVQKQKLYNAIVEEYIKNHQEGAIETMPNILKEMLLKPKNVGKLEIDNKRIKKGSENSLTKCSGIAEVLHKIKPYIGVAGAGLATWRGVHDYRKGKAELNDIKDRFNRKKQQKAEADIFVQKVRMPLYKKHEGTDEKIKGFEELFKSGADNSPILPHQQRVIDRLKKNDQPGLILMHGLGSGKTRSSIEAYKALGLPAEVVLPAALKGNYEKELIKWIGKQPKDVHIQSQQMVGREGADSADFAGKLMIVDEAHRMRNEDTQLYKALKKVSPAKRLLLTGTPIYNHPSDIAKLINVAAGKEIMPERRPEFEKEYIAQKTIFPSFAHRVLGVRPGQELSIKNKDYLKAVFGKLVDYHGGSDEGFPDVKNEVVKVPMGEKQQQIYKALMKELPWHMRLKVRAGLPPDRKELDKLIPFLSGARMISNSTDGFDKADQVQSPKIEAAAKYLQQKIQEDPTYKGLVYSNYLGSGVAPYKKILEQNNIPYGEFTGEINDKLRNQLVQDYNNNKLKALLVSSAGGEGLDLKGTRLVQLLEPHFNNEKIKQVIGRAARYRSHESLPEDKRNVLIQHYLSTLNPGILDKLRRKTPTSTDEYLQNLADQKEQLNNEFIKLIKR
jgi:superfamily II DNA or RNA helicase